MTTSILVAGYGSEVFPDPAHCTDPWRLASQVIGTWELTGVKPKLRR
jgi:hypothetical protein